MDWTDAEIKVKDCSDIIKSHVFFMYTLCGFHLNGLSYSQYLEAVKTGTRSKIHKGQKCYESYARMAFGKRAGMRDASRNMEDILASLLPLSAKSSNKFDYSS